MIHTPASSTVLPLPERLGSQHATRAAVASGGAVEVRPMAKRKPAHHRGDYARRAKAVRDAANADPTTRCWRCGRTQAEHGQPWQAGHLNDGQVGGPLRAECRACNAGAGARLGSRRRKGLIPTRDW